MNDISEVQIMERKLVHSRNEFFNLLRDPDDFSNRESRKLYESIIFKLKHGC
jgi:hypothetical protein